MDSERSSAPEAFKALGDPVRWTMVQHMAREPELAGSVLDEVLAISRPTISYHIRILTQAGLVDVSKRGRNHYYTLRRDVLGTLLDELDALAPGLRPTVTAEDATLSPAAEPGAPAASVEVAPAASAAPATPVPDEPELPEVLPTW
jgi:DNA-binding transcriptional ArsR family regulator